MGNETDGTYGTHGILGTYGTYTMLRLLLSTLLLLTLIGCSHLKPETSPGEVKAVAFSQRGGAENPAQYTVAIVVNKRNDVLLSQVQRPQDRQPTRRRRRQK